MSSAEDLECEVPEDHNHVTEVKQRPEFAALCSFIHHFGMDLGIYLTFPQLSQFLDVPDGTNLNNWETLHVKLLNKLKFRARPDKWETVMGRFLEKSYPNVEELANAATCLQHGMSTLTSPNNVGTKSRPHFPRYYGLDAHTRTKILLCLLESQFDRNQSFKDKVNLRSSADLRFRPLGSDVWGRVYWLLKDTEINILLYREDEEGESIELICETTEEMRKLYTELRDACPESLKLADILSRQMRGQPSHLAKQPISPFLSNGLHVSANKMEGMKQDETSLLLNNADAKIELPPKSPISNECGSDSIPNTATSFDKTDIKQDPNGILDDLHEKKQCFSEVNENLACDKSELKPEDKDELIDETSLSSLVPKNSKKEVQSNPIDTVHVEETHSDHAQPAVRRSCRQRKPVEFLTMEPIQPKRGRKSANFNKSGAGELKKNNKDDKVSNNKKKRKDKAINGCKSNDIKKIKKKKKKRRHKRGKKSSNPWIKSSSSETDEDDDTFEQALLEHQYESSSEVSAQKSSKEVDWLDVLESDFNPNDLTAESDADSLIQGRNLARQKRLQRKMTDAFVESSKAVNNTEEESCEICGRSHLPEWMLLCDRCNLGHHAMCLRPPLFVIPEGDWFCPRCQHLTLLTALREHADLTDADQKKQTLWKRMQERLNFVNISMTNILADKDDEEAKNFTKLRRHRRSPNVMYKETESDSVTSDEAENTASDEEEYSSGDFTPKRGHRMSGRAYPARQSDRTCIRKHVRKRRLYDEVSSVSSEHSSLYAPRTTRHVQARYDLKEAFKSLDEAIAEDEKYQTEKIRRQHDKQQRLSGETEISPDGSSSPPPGQSRGKDLRNILGPDWDELDDKPPVRTRHKRHRKSSSTSDSNEDNGSGDDVDFKPSLSEGDEDTTGESEREDEKSLSSESASSDGSWLCSARRKLKKRRSCKRSRRNNQRRSGRPVPRFEESSEDERSDRGSSVRPKRHSALTVNYKESEEDSSEAPVSRQLKRRRFLPSSDEEEYQNVNEPGRTVISSLSQSQEVSGRQPQSHYCKPEVNSGASDGESFEGGLISRKKVNASAHSSVFKRMITESSSEANSPSRLMISESSPDHPLTPTAPLSDPVTTSPLFNKMDPDCVDSVTINPAADQMIALKPDPSDLTVDNSFIALNQPASVSSIVPAPPRSPDIFD